MADPALSSETVGCAGAKRSLEMGSFESRPSCPLCRMIDGRSPPPSPLSPFFPPALLFCSLPLLLSPFFYLRSFPLSLSLSRSRRSRRPVIHDEEETAHFSTARLAAAGNTRNLRTETVRAHSIAIKVRYRRSSDRPVSTLFFSVTVVAHRAAFD